MTMPRLQRRISLSASSDCATVPWAEHFEIDLILASSAEPQVGKGTALDVAAHFFSANPPARPLPLGGRNPVLH